MKILFLPFSLILFATMPLFVGCSTDVKSNRKVERPSMNTGNPRKIALLLPSRGPHAKAAQTIRDGFFAGYYKTLPQQPAEASVQVYDTTAEGGVIAAYQKALNDNVGLIVGPLTKPEVQQIAGMRLDVPVLALNTIQNKGSNTANSRTVQSNTRSGMHSPNLYQFGLMPEDEVYAVAKHACNQGHRRALIIAPKSEWGNRMTRAFMDSFMADGGRIVQTLMLSPEHDLAEKIRSVLETKTAQRRTDIDMIFLAASPEMGRQVKPLLNQHKAQDLPVYATASIYSGTPLPTKDLNLDNVRFCDMPWVLSNSSELLEARKKLADIWPNSFTQAPRYFALGLDAYQIAAELCERKIPLSGLTGATGELRVDNQQHIQRRLVCAKFENGVPVPD